MKLNHSLVAIAVSLAVSPLALAQQTLEKTRVNSDKEPVEVIKKIEINADQINDQMITDIYDTVRYIPGVDVNNTGNRFGANGFNIRGLEGDAVAITVDGISQGESLDPLGFSRYGMFSSTRNNIEPQSVKTVQIVKGANSITAGSGALGGAVMYTTKDPSDYLTQGDFGGSVKFGYDGRNKESLANVAVAGRYDLFEVMLNVTHRDGSELQAHSSGADVEGPARGLSDPFDNEKTNVLAKLNILPNEAHRIGFVVEDFSGESQGRPLSRQSAAYFDFEAFDESSRERLGLSYYWLANLAMFDDVEVRYNDQEIFNRGSTLFQFASRGQEYLRNEDRNYTQESTELVIDFTKQVAVQNVTHAIAYGVKFVEGEVSNELQDIRYNGTTVDSGLRDGYPIIDPSWVPDTKTETFTAYVSDLIELSDSLTVDLGVRYDKTSYKPTVDDTFKDPTGTAVQDAEFSALTWAANIGYQFAPGHTITAGVGTGFKAPTTQQLYYNTDATSTVEDSRRVVDPDTGSVAYVGTGREEIDLNTVANPDLKAEEGINYELSYQWNGDNTYFNVTLFRADYDNFIVNLNQTNPYSATLTSATFNFFNPACRAAVLTDACWIVEALSGDEYGVPTNTGEIETSGFEIAAGWQISDGLQLTFAHSAMKGEYKNTVSGVTESTGIDATFEAGDELESVAPDTTVVGLQYQATDNWGASVFARHIDGKDEQDSFSATFYSDSATVVDLAGYYDISENIVVRATVTNLFDEDYTLWQTVRLVREGSGGFFGGVDMSEGNSGIDRFSQPGREFQINLTYTF